jgi:hypothetical protein
MTDFARLYRRFDEVLRPYGKPIDFWPVRPPILLRFPMFATHICVSHICGAGGRDNETGRHLFAGLH